MLNKKTLLVIIISLIVATFFHWNGHSEIGIIASAFIGPGVGISVGEAYDD